MSASRLDEWGLRAAEQLETSVGAWVALASYKRLLEVPPPVQTRALLGALRCAVALRDPAEFEMLIGRWAAADGTWATEEPLALARTELARGDLAMAVALGRAELKRRPRARTAYAAARLLEGAPASASEALETMAHAQTLALQEGDLEVATACAARRLEALEHEARAAPEHPFRAEALAIVAEIDPAGARGAARLHVARARLLAPGRFVRAGALSALGELVGGSDDAVAAAAAWSIARHVDAMGVRLTPIEGERAVAGLSAVRDEATRNAVISRAREVVAFASAPAAERASRIAASARGDATSAELLSRARHLDEGPSSTSFGRDRFRDPYARLAALGLEALGAMTHGRQRAAESALEVAARSIGPAEAVPAPLWRAAEIGLTQRGETRGAALALARVLVQRAGGEPPRGFGPLGSAIAAAGELPVALEALRLAARSKEPDGRAALARVATSAAWRAHERGAHHVARDLLLEAKAAAAG